MDNVTEIVERYTGVQLDQYELNVNNPKMATLLQTITGNIDDTERHLQNIASRYKVVASKVDATIAGTTMSTLNPLGEVQGDNIDRLIAVRHSQIQCLRAIVQYYNSQE